MDLIANLNWQNPSWDLFIILFFIVASLLYGVSLGRSRIIVILVSMYMTLAVINAAPFLKDAPETEIGIENIFVFKIASFFVVCLGLFFFLSRSALIHTIASSEAPGSWWQVILFSFLHVGLLISIILSFLPLEALSQLTAVTREIFATETARFLWIAAPLLAMILVRKEKKEE